MKQKLDVDRLKENAITSIRLGIEDFQVTQQERGDKARALSSIRNLFSGLLLLFKYKIASLVNSPDDAEKLIFNPISIEPVLDGNGGISWEPSEKFKSTTIYFLLIKKRFDTFKIKVDWPSLTKIQTCRNHLEHLHPENTLGEVAEIVSNLFPILKEFIEIELNSNPYELLGESWIGMYKHHETFIKKKKECEELWEGVHMPESLRLLTTDLRCFICHINLLFPEVDGDGDGKSLYDDEDKFLCNCAACGNSQLVIKTIIDRIETINYLDMRNGDNPEFETCYTCNRDMFNTIEKVCFWCDEGLLFTECSICSQPLGQDEQSYDGLCGYHHYVREKNRWA